MAYCIRSGKEAVCVALQIGTEMPSDAECLLMDVFANEISNEMR